MKSSYIAAGAGVALLVILIVIWQLVVYARSAPVASQFTVIVAVIALIGVLWTGAITFAGLLLKDSVDRRSAQLQAESEKRLRMDTALKAIELMSQTKAGGTGAQESREAALLVISSLNHPQLALRLGEQFWSANKISTPTFVQITYACLESDDEVAKADAAAALRLNYEKLCDRSDNIEFPEAYCMKWSGNLPSEAKDDLVNAILLALLSKKFSYWSNSLLNWIIYCFYKMFLNDPDPRFQYAVAMYATELCNLMPGGLDTEILPHDRPFITYREICTATNGFMSQPNKPLVSAPASQLAERIRDWTKPKPKATPPKVASPKPARRRVGRKAKPVPSSPKSGRPRPKSPPGPPAPRRGRRSGS